VLEPGVRVLKLGQLHLQPAFVGAGVGGEDVQDQLAAVEDLAPRGLLEVADLRRAEVVVEDDDVDVVEIRPPGDFLRLARADVQLGKGLGALGDHFVDDESSGRLGQAAKLPYRIHRIGLGARQEHANQQRPFPLDRQIRTFHFCHRVLTPNSSSRLWGAAGGDS